MKALLRRYHVYQGKSVKKEEETVYQSGDLKIDSRHRQAYLGKQKLELTDIEFDILEYLVINKRQVISPSQLFEAIWHEDYYYGANNTIMVHIRHLRQKIEEDPQNPIHIKTIWGKGYYCE